MTRIIQRNRSLIPACDVDLRRFLSILEGTKDIDEVGGYKIGFRLALSKGLPEIVKWARDHTDKPLIYDHQKAATDIPDTGKSFAEVVKNAGIDAVILFPQAGPATEEAWIKAAQDLELGVIVGGKMTHSEFLESEGGYIADNQVKIMYQVAADLGVSDFVVPGNDSGFIGEVRIMLERMNVDPTFYAPGFVTQGGVISEGAEVAGKRFHAIVGRGIYNAEDMRQATLDLASQL